MQINNKKFNIIVISILLIAVIARYYFVAYKTDRDILVDRYSKKNVEITGFISSEPLLKDFNKSFIFHVDEVKIIRTNNDTVKGVVKDTVIATDDVENETGKDTNIDSNNKYEPADFYIKVQAERYIEYEYGQKLRLYGKLNAPFNFKSNGNRVFDYINFLSKDGIYFEMKKPKIEYLKNNEISIIRNLFKIKQSFLDNLKSVLGEPHAALAGGLVVGEKSALGKDLINDFRKAGLIHIVVLSGYNITIVADSIRKILSFLPRTTGIILGGFGILGFGILVGGGATVVRSCIMAIIALSASLIRRDYNVGRALFIAGIFMLIQNPLILFYDPSFQLSFLATLGLLSLSEPIEKILPEFITDKWGIRGLVASTLATQIFVSPYLLYMMGQLSIIGIFVNILVLPIIPLTMLLVTLSGLFGFFSYFLSKIFGWLAYFLLSYELYIVRTFANFPFSNIELPKFSFWIVTGFYLSYLIAFMKLPSTFSQFKFTKKSPT